MSIQDIRDPAAIRAAMDEYDRVGRTYFLEKYGFGKSREYMLRDAATGRLYDSKAIVGAAHGYALPGEPLGAADVSGAEATIQRLLPVPGLRFCQVPTALHPERAADGIAQLGGRGLRTTAPGSRP